MRTLTLLLSAAALLAAACSEPESDNNSEDAQELSAGEELKAQLAECAPPHYGFFSSTRDWARRAEAVFDLGPHGGDPVEVRFEGSVSAEAWPEGRTLPKPLSAAHWLAVPGGDTGLAVPPAVAELGQSYTLHSGAHWTFAGGWSAAVLRDAQGQLRALSASGGVGASRGFLEEAGWTVTFTAACWTVECADPVLHHDVTLTHGEQSWSLPMGAAQEVTVGGRPFKVFNDAAALPAPGTVFECRDVEETYWNVAIIALD